MNKPDVKKLILLNLPYVFAFYFADKIAAVFRLAPGTEFIDKLTNGFAVFGTAFANPLPSFHPVDLSDILPKTDASFQSQSTCTCTFLFSAIFFFQEVLIYGN